MSSESLFSQGEGETTYTEDQLAELQNGCQLALQIESNLEIAKLQILRRRSRGNLARTPDVAVVIPLKQVFGPCG
jgi:hypothetical protein